VACPLICRICGGIARGTNFSTISCMSCKMFFRRHGKSQLVRYLITVKKNTVLLKIIYLVRTTMPF
jgi:hypothetical protein